LVSVDYILERISGKKVAAEVVLITQDEIKKVHKKDGWLFNWKKEYKNDQRQLYKLIVLGNPAIQGILSLEAIKGQQFIEMHLVELAPNNKGQNRQYFGVARHLVAFACKKSFEMGFEGYVVFTSKTMLIDHYIESLGASILYGQRMCIFPEGARKLVNSYYKTL